MAQPPRDAVLAQIDRLANSDLLKGSESLCRLLRYLAQQGITSPGTPIKEYQIATEVFGRSADFDPRLDSTVRVQTGRLRSKLAEYYGGIGSSDRIVVELPKGSYSLFVHERAVEPVQPPALPITIREAAAPGADRRSRMLLTAVWALSIVAIGLLASLLILLFNRPQPVQPAAGAPALRDFWRAFVDGPERPWVVFSNAAFVGRPETGMRYFDVRRDAGTPILDHYTGVGEVLAVHELDGLFGALGHGMRVKRGRLLSLDDAKNNDLIFIGSPSENLTLLDMPDTREFVFRRLGTGARAGDLEIANLKPRAGEAAAFVASAGIPLTEDYALLALIPGLNSGRWIMILAGTSTIGTQGAVEFVTHDTSAQELVNRVGLANRLMKPFEAVIRVKISGGVPVANELVAVHAR